jgi:Tfp pilus assembly protein PilX
MKVIGKLNTANYREQQGMVLVISLVFLVALTAVAAALMQNSTTDMKMSGATEEKSVALQEVVSAADEVIFNELAPGVVNRFALPINGDNFPVVAANLLPGTRTNATAQINVANNDSDACPALKGNNNNSQGTIGCNNFRVTINRNFGRTNQNVITVNTGVTQQFKK